MKKHLVRAAFWQFPFSPSKPKPLPVLSQIFGVGTVFGIVGEVELAARKDLQHEGVPAFLEIGLDAHPVVIIDGDQSLVEGAVKAG